jgi:hypothetical protein
LSVEVRTPLLNVTITLRANKASVEVTIILSQVTVTIRQINSVTFEVPLSVMVPQ